MPYQHRHRRRCAGRNAPEITCRDILYLDKESFLFSWIAGALDFIVYLHRAAQRVQRGGRIRGRLGYSVPLHLAHIHLAPEPALHVPPGERDRVVRLVHRRNEHARLQDSFVFHLAREHGHVMLQSVLARPVECAGLDLRDHAHADRLPVPAHQPQRPQRGPLIGVHEEGHGPAVRESTKPRNVTLRQAHLVEQLVGALHVVVVV